MRLAVRIVVCLVAILTPTWAMAQSPPRAVLIIDEADPSGAPTTFSATLRETLDDVTPHIAVYGETLDLSRFSGPSQEAILRSYLQEKYSDVRFGVIAAVGLLSLEFVRRWRSELWPGVPVIFAAIDETSAAQLKLDPDMTGLIMRRTIGSMMAAARLLVSDLKGVAVLGGSLQHDAYRRQYAQELSASAAEIEVTRTGKARSGAPLGISPKEHGLGLGLSKCSKIVRAHGGQLTIENNVGGGAAVTVTLPTRDDIAVPT